MERFIKNLPNLDKFYIEDVKVILKPKEFHREVLEQLQISENVFIITLYMGSLTGSVQIMKEIQNRIIDNKNIQIIIDYHRNMENPEALELMKKFQIEDHIFYANKRKYSLIPPLIYELLFVLHAKVYIFDTKVILTGANLDDTYFTTRLDRYLLINDPFLANYLYEKVFLHIFKNQHFHIVSKNSNISDRSVKNIKLEKFKDRTPFQKLKHTIIMPYREYHELYFIKKIFTYNFNEFYLSTAYINIPETYLKYLEKQNVSIFVPNTKCNTFKGSGLINRLICHVYEYFAYWTKERLQKSSVYTFYKKKSSFHIKGIWAFSNNFAVTVIGSSNFNERSYRKDTELCTFIITRDKALINHFRSEVKYLLDHSDKISKPKRKNFLIQIISYLFKYFF